MDDTVRLVLSTYFEPSLCAHLFSLHGQEFQCQKPANSTCAACKLVLYCARDCQSRDWKNHKKTCKGPLMQKFYEPGYTQQQRLPRFPAPDGIDHAPVSPLGIEAIGLQLRYFGDHEYLWGDVPALNILNLPENEGTSSFDRDFDFLFAASGDLRNVLKTINGLPDVDKFSGKCTTIINDRSFTVAARNVIMLLIAYKFDESIATSMIIHLWYSAKIPSIMLHLIRKEILPFIEEACETFKIDKPNLIQTMVVESKKRTLRASMAVRQWDQLRQLLSPPDRLTIFDADRARQRKTMANHREDQIDLLLYSMPPSARVGYSQYRKDGIFLPFGCARGIFDAPNPFFYTDSDTYVMNGLSHPLHSGSPPEYAKYATAASGDTYGSLFFFLRDTVRTFCTRIRQNNINFIVWCANASHIPYSLEMAGLKEMRFDRIEASSICDAPRGHLLGPQPTLVKLGPLLKSIDVNPHATLLLCFVTMVREEESQDENRSLDGPLDKLWPFIDVPPGILSDDGVSVLNADLRDPFYLHMASCFKLFGDFDKYFDEMLGGRNLHAVAESSGLAAKEEHTIIRPWPFRLTDKTERKGFDDLIASGVSGSERYMEFRWISANPQSVEPCERDEQHAPNALAFGPYQMFLNLWFIFKAYVQILLGRIGFPVN